MGLFVSIGVDLGIYAYMPVAFGPILVDLIVFTVVVTVGGLLIGLVYGKPEEVVPETPEAPEPEAPPKE